MTAKKIDQVPSVEPVEQSAGSDLPVEWESPSLPTVFSGHGAALERSDIILPRLTLIQRVGDLSVIFPQGSWVLNREVQLTDKPEEPLTITVLQNPVKYYQEALPYNPEGPRPRTFESVEAIREAGLTLDWGATNARPTAEALATTVVLVKKPENAKDELSFSQVIPGIGPCALAKWTLMRTAYTRAAKRLFTAIALELGGRPIRHMGWQLQGLPAKVSGYNIFVPKLTPIGFWPNATTKELDSKFAPAEKPSA